MDHSVAAAPNFSQIVEVARSARHWLASTMQRMPEDSDVAGRMSCQVLIAFWITDAMAGHEALGSPSFREVAQDVARSLNSLQHSTRFDGVKPTLKLLAEVLLSSEGLEVEPFRRFLAQSASILRRPDPVLEADPLLMDKRILLHSAGVLPNPPEASAAKMQALLENLHLAMPADAVDALILQLECITGWGTRPVGADLIAPSLSDIFAGLAVHRLRNYDLIAAARLIRLQEYVLASGIPRPRDDLYNILLMQRQRGGPFGWFGPEAAELRKRSEGSLEDTEFLLPTTLECLWALAERSVVGWRLLGNVPPYGLI